MEEVVDEFRREGRKGQRVRGRWLGPRIDAYVIRVVSVVRGYGGGPSLARSSSISALILTCQIGPWKLQSTLLTDSGSIKLEPDPSMESTTQLPDSGRFSPPGTAGARDSLRTQWRNYRFRFSSNEEEGGVRG